DHDVLEVREARQTPLRQHRVRELLAGGHRIAAELAGRVHGVLRLQGGGDLVHGDVELRQRVGIDPEPDGVLRGAEDQDLADAGHPCHRVVDVDVRVVGEEQRVVGTLGRVQREEPQRAGHRLDDGDALVDHVGRKLGGGLRVAQVGEHLVDARVGGDVGVHPQLHLAAGGLVERVHVVHLVYVDTLFLDLYGDRL